jgi:hypothetical protein
MDTCRKETCRMETCRMETSRMETYRMKTWQIGDSAKLWWSPFQKIFTVCFHHLHSMSFFSTYFTMAKDTAIHFVFVKSMPNYKTINIVVWGHVIHFHTTLISLNKLTLHCPFSCPPWNGYNMISPAASIHTIKERIISATRTSVTLLSSHFLWKR